MYKKLYHYRYEIFLFSQVAILFGSLIIPSAFFDAIASSILFQFSLLAGILLLSKEKRFIYFISSLFLLNASVLVYSNIFANKTYVSIDLIKLLSYLVFYIILMFELMKQIWHSKIITRNVIYGLISGFIGLGFIGFFLFLSIETIYPNSFKGFYIISSLTENIMYYSYITLLTIGYGDILPVTPLAQKATILIGLVGQIYLVIVTGVIVGKYINQEQN